MSEINTVINSQRTEKKRLHQANTNQSLEQINNQQLDLTKEIKVRRFSLICTRREEA
mgnify:FL=1